jgi:DNA ligase D-like protein (predicted 3'-phosphoesterase)
MSRKDSLREYRRKRDLSRSKEPSGRRRRSQEGPVFVVQKHDASTLHYDFRLEADGVLKSWSVPKGPSTDPRDKRMAVPTEDHPLEYAGFEGVIPEGEYGAGSVIVWDTGTYENLSDDKDGGRIEVAEALEHGHVTFRLHGQKLQGGYSLTRMRENAWLLVKTRDDDADARRNPVSTQPESLSSGLTNEQVAAEDS